MAKQPFISHVVNGYSRYDVPESKAFSCTPGLLYPVRIDFINARDRVRIDQGIDVRSNPFVVPSFNPYTVRLHRFWVPLQLYHPELRTNSSDFDMNDLSLNWVRSTYQDRSFALASDSGAGYPNSLMFWLRVSNRNVTSRDTAYDYSDTALPSSAKAYSYVNADSYLAYWDIIRNFYSYSQWSLYSFAWPASWKIQFAQLPTVANPSGSLAAGFVFTQSSAYFQQCFGNLQYLDKFYETQFYPNSVASSNNTYNRSNLFFQIVASDLSLPAAAASDGYPICSRYVDSTHIYSNSVPKDQLSVAADTSTGTYCTSAELFLSSHPLAVAPSSPDRFSRLLPPGTSNSSVPLSALTTIPQLAVASRLQEYKDLLGAGGSRYSDWLETFFASKIDHVDRPKLLFSASQTVNVQVIMNQSGTESANGTLGGSLGQMGGSIAFNTHLGKSQSYYFSEPGYLIDILSIRPVYYWSQIRPDYLSYLGADYFNPVYNDIGYQDVAAGVIYTTPDVDPYNTVAQEPCFNEFRSSYDEVLGSLSDATNSDVSKSIYSSWVQQRSSNNVPLNYASNMTVGSYLFTNLSSVNDPFASDVEDNFFVNLSYSVRKKNLINKTFATRLSSR